MNPAVIMEVLSNTTEAYDRRDKFRRYRTIPSLQQYVLVSQDAPRIETYTREPGDLWVLHEIYGLEAMLHIRSIQVDVPLSEIYELIEFTPVGSVLIRSN